MDYRLTKRVLINQHLKPANGNRLLLIFCIYSLTIFVYRDFGVPAFAGYLLLGAGFLYYLGLERIQLRLNSVTVLLGLLFVFQIIEIAGSIVIQDQYSQVMYIPAFVIIWFYVAAESAGVQDLENVKRIWFTVSAVLVIYVLIVAAYPAFYYSFIKHFLTIDSQATVESLLQKGYGIAIGANIIIIDYILIFCFLYCVYMGLYVRGMPGNRYLRYFAIAVVLLAAIVLENRKSEVLALFITTLILVVMKDAARDKTAYVKNLKLVFMLVLLMFVIICLLYKTGHLGRYGSMIDGIITRHSSGIVQDISSGRLRLWGMALMLFFQHPYFGIGWGNFSTYVPDNLVQVFDIHNVHNCYLQILCETGVVGFMCIMVIWAALIISQIKSLKEIKKSGIAPQYQALAYAGILYQVFFLIVGGIDPAFYSLIFWCLYSLSIMVINAVVRMAKDYRDSWNE